MAQQKSNNFKFNQTLILTKPCYDRFFLQFHLKLLLAYNSNCTD